MYKRCIRGNCTSNSRKEWKSQAHAREGMETNLDGASRGSLRSTYAEVQTCSEMEQWVSELAVAVLLVQVNVMGQRKQPVAVVP